MYLPAAYRVDDPARIRAFLRDHGFATVVSHASGGTAWGSHLPLLLDASSQGDRLLGHMARANGQWEHFAAGGEILCIFHGPHAYISPSWYEAEIAVPTWNYAAIHVYGVPQVETDPAFVRKVLDDTVAKYESAMAVPWRMDFPEETLAAFLKAIVAFSVRITRVEAKFKVGQNRSAEDQAGMLAALEAAADPEGRALARFIRSDGQGEARAAPQPP